MVSTDCHKPHNPALFIVDRAVVAGNIDASETLVGTAKRVIVEKGVEWIT